MDAEQENNFIGDIVREQLPDETAIIGETTLQDIIEGYSEFEGGGAGLRADMISIIQAVAAAVAIVKGTLEVFKLWRELHGKEPTAEEVQSELVRRGAVLREAADAFVKTLITVTLSRIPRIH